MGREIRETLFSSRSLSGLLPRGVPAIDAAGNVLVAICVAAWLLCRSRSCSSADFV
jgi:hypothetical protein